MPRPIEVKFTLSVFLYGRGPGMDTGAVQAADLEKHLETLLVNTFELSRREIVAVEVSAGSINAGLA